MSSTSHEKGNNVQGSSVSGKMFESLQLRNGDTLRCTASRLYRVVVEAKSDVGCQQPL